MCFLPMFDENQVLEPWKDKPCGFPSYFRLSATATATRRWTPTIGLLPMPRKPIISTCAGTRMSRRTVRRNACGPWYRSYRRTGPQPFVRCRVRPYRPKRGGEILLALLDALFLVGAGDGVPSRLVESTGDGDVHTLGIMMATPPDIVRRRSSNRRALVSLYDLAHECSACR